MDIIKVHWKNKMLKTCTVVCLVQIIISKCASIVVCQFCQSKSYQNHEQEMSDGQTVADDVHELFLDSPEFQGTVRSGSVSSCPMSEGYFPGLINEVAGKSRVDISSPFSFPLRMWSLDFLTTRLQF